MKVSIYHVKILDLHGAKSMVVLCSYVKLFALLSFVSYALSNSSTEYTCIHQKANHLYLAKIKYSNKQ